MLFGDRVFEEVIKPKQAFKVDPDPELRWIVSLQGDQEPDKRDSCERTLRKTLSSSHGGLWRPYKDQPAASHTSASRSFAWLL